MVIFGQDSFKITVHSSNLTKKYEYIHIRILFKILFFLVVLQLLSRCTQVHTEIVIVFCKVCIISISASNKRDKGAYTTQKIDNIQTNNLYHCTIKSIFLTNTYWPRVWPLLLFIPKLKEFRVHTHTRDMYEKRYKNSKVSFIQNTHKNIYVNT